MRTLEQTFELFLHRSHRLSPLRLARSLPTAGRDRDSGLIALEWLLIVAAIAGLAASSTLVVQRTLDSTVEIPGDVHVRLIDADIAAAQIAAEATAWREGLDPNQRPTLNRAGDYNHYKQRCRGLETAFDDVVATVEWSRPQEYDEEYDEDENFVGLIAMSLDQQVAYDAGEIAAPAQCTVRAGLGG